MCTETARKQTCFGPITGPRPYLVKLGREARLGGIEAHMWIVSSPFRGR